jgi:hypothetical protein
MKLDIFNFFTKQLKKNMDPHIKTILKFSGLVAAQKSEFPLYLVSSL